ncbi:uncharacterized protein LOC116262144 [Nymphaea colorata]|nr:uncharacterized protein LOC116262144 [Nymphaea colorata]
MFLRRMNLLRKDEKMLRGMKIITLLCHIAPTIAYYTKAKDMWSLLRKTYSHATNVIEILQLEEELCNIRQGDQDLSQYFATLTAAYEWLKALRPLCRHCYASHFETGGRGHGPYVGPRGRGAGRGVGRDRFQCTFCGKLDHLEDRCWDKHPHLHSVGPPGRGGGRVAASKSPSSQTASSKATISMAESSNDPPISMPYSLNLRMNMILFLL